jgi:hypothetical protein
MLLQKSKSRTARAAVASTGTALRDYVLIPTRLISDPELPRQLRLFRLEFVLVITSLPPFITFHLQQATSYGAANMT